ncbi:MAG: hypothetical protein OXH31_00715 [Gammaproteobacteria bacterium]|nr:hypothetical protein [Gammaproteobacteria bacterium]
MRIADFAIDDFEVVRPYGSIGDLKCDGWQASTGTVFQCYAPYAMQESALNRKIERDFDGAREKWDLKKWVFVHNDTRGLPPTANQLIDKLRTNSGVTIQIWTEPEIFELVERLSRSQLEILFGPALTAAELPQVEPQNVKELIDEIVLETASVSVESITPPSAEKLQKNLLSDAVRDLLTVGRFQENKVRKLLDKGSDVMRGEHIAQSFRQRYSEFKAADISPDEIFFGLQCFIVGYEATSPQRQAASLAILSYFFDRCDIFEDD